MSLPQKILRLFQIAIGPSPKSKSPERLMYCLIPVRRPLPPVPLNLRNLNRKNQNPSGSNPKRLLKFALIRGLSRALEHRFRSNLTRRHRGAKRLPKIFRPIKNVQVQARSKLSGTIASLWEVRTCSTHKSRSITRFIPDSTKQSHQIGKV